MNSGMVSMRYARALFSYALEKKAEDTIFSEMNILSENLASSSQLRATLDNPVLSTREKLELIKLAVGETISDVFVRFIQLVLHQRRENHLQTISLVYLDLYRKYKNISVGKLVTACPVDDTTINKIKQLVKQKEEGTIEFVTEVDPKLGGGFILYIGTYRLDASVASQLSRIKSQLMSKNKKIA
ncbi:F0F1 ATP synthase subunit delta [Dysgonomonas sp. HDW5B]|uniref:F0F1 ATP synthase subunit delta n=1 Tax=Dysgonomonas sp. HDW5B TaxID=2714927 RepID=UPI00140A863D|nr:F0F1 ATP synthase subunit delta [Dysgonomonas sp. HDW5B]QIK53046.1 F0F1 ATP synthase subunit delta [Dysgonomonas sp. HDW5B]